MQWLPKRRSTRTVMMGLAGFLALGGIVGAATLDGAPGTERQAVRVTPPGDDGSIDAMITAGGDRGSAFDEPLPSPSGQPRMITGSASAAPMVVEESGSGGEHGSAGDAAGGGSGPVVSGQSLPPIETGRVVKTATVDIEVDEDGFAAARERVLEVAAAVGGFTQSSLLENRTATFTLRVPSEDFDATLKRLRDLGEVKHESLSGEDVTEEFVDLESRLRHWRAQEAVFLDLMTRAETVSETIEVQRQLSTVQQNIEQIEGRKRFLEDRTELSTVTLTLRTAGAVAPEPGADAGPSLSEAWDKAWDAGIEVVGGTLIVLGALVPLAAILAIPALLIAAAMRRRRGPAAPAASPAG